MVCCLSVQSSLNFSLSCTLAGRLKSSWLGFAPFRGLHYGSTSSITSSAFWPSSNTLDLCLFRLRLQGMDNSGKTLDFSVRCL